MTFSLETFILVQEPPPQVLWNLAELAQAQKT